MITFSIFDCELNDMVIKYEAVEPGSLPTSQDF